MLTLYTVHELWKTLEERVSKDKPRFSPEELLFVEGEDLLVVIDEVASRGGGVVGGWADRWVADLGHPQGVFSWSWLEQRTLVGNTGELAISQPAKEH